MLFAAFLLLAAASVEGTATAISAVIAPIITHVTKKFFGVDSMWAYIIHVGASALVTILSLSINQQLSVGTFADRFTTVAFISQTLFHVFKRKSGLTTDITEEPVTEEKLPAPPDAPLP